MVLPSLSCFQLIQLIVLQVLQFSSHQMLSWSNLFSTHVLCSLSIADSLKCLVMKNPRLRQGSSATNVCSTMSARTSCTAHTVLWNRKASNYSSAAISSPSVPFSFTTRFFCTEYAVAYCRRAHLTVSCTSFKGGTHLIYLTNVGSTLSYPSFIEQRSRGSTFIACTASLQLLSSGTNVKLFNAYFKASVA